MGRARLGRRERHSRSLSSRRPSGSSSFRSLVSRALGAGVCRSLASVPFVMVAAILLPVESAHANAPTVSSIAITSTPPAGQDGKYKIGDWINITVTFSEAVTFDGDQTQGKELKLQLRIGSASNIWELSDTGAVSNSTTIGFGHQVAEGDLDTDGVSIPQNPLSLFGGATVRDSDGNNAVLTHAGLGNQSAHKVDGVRPTVMSLVGRSGGSGGWHKAGTGPQIRVVFSEDVKITGVTRLAGKVGTTTRQFQRAAGFSHGGEEGDRKDYTYVVLAGETDADGISVDAGSITLVGSATIKDVAGNAMASPAAHPAMSAQSDLRVDTGNPGIEFPTTGPWLGTASTITLTDTLSKVARFAVLEVAGTATDATGCDSPAPTSLGGDGFTATAVAPAASPKTVLHTPAAVGKKLCVFVEDAAGNRHSALWNTPIQAPPPPAPGLVSNTGQTTSVGGGFVDDVAQAFTTGPTADVHRLTGVSIPIQNTSTTAPTYTVRIHAESSGSPGAALGTLANPASLPANGTARFTASGNGIALAANTTYFVVIDTTSAGTGTVYRSLTLSDAEDSGGAAGWSIADSRLRRAHAATTWLSSPHALKLAVHGRRGGQYVTRHGLELSEFKVEEIEDSRQLRVSWRVHNAGRNCSYVIAWRKTSSPAESWLEPPSRIDPSRWRTRNGMEASSYGGRPSFKTLRLEPGTPYEVRLYVRGPGGYVKPSDADMAFQTTVTTSGQQMAPPPITVAGPALSSARVNGAQMLLSFDASLDESSVPAASAFAVSVAGSARSVSAVSVSLDRVILTLASVVTSGQVVTVGYTPPSTGKLRASGGGADVAAFSGQAVTNDTAGGQQQESEPPPAALTASVASAPSEHRGKGKFTVQIAFSEAVAGGAKEAASTIQVTGGTLLRARRAGGAARWALDLRPSGYGAVTLTLPATTDCSAAGAVCTADGRKLETPLTHTVQGPPALSVADARAQEEADATIDFAVTLSRAASAPVTVRYVTRDGTAKMGRDYRKAKGMLTFAAGETSKTVSVTLLDDAHDEGAETFLLKLHKPKGAHIADGEATGTIENSDPLQQAWLARFGRAAASDAIAAVTARLETPRDAGSHLTFAGQRLDFSGDGAALAQTLTGLARAFGAREVPANDNGAFARHGLSGGWNDPVGAPARQVTARALLTGTSFRAVFGQGARSQFTSWGQGASVSQFSGSTPGLNLSGETATGSMGMDYERGRLLTGFAMTHSLAEGTAQGAGQRYLMGSAVTTMLPYARLAISDRVSAWGLAGTGSGELRLDLDGGAAERYRADLSMTLAAAGVRGELLTPAEAGGFALALKADAFWVRTESDSVSAPGVGNLAAARADASRVRAVLDGSRTFSLAGGATLTPRLELGVRQDGGDAETGTGMELGAGVGYADPSRGLDMALRVHGLAGHAEDGYSEWGVSGSLRLVPGGAGRGLSASLTPSYGVDPGGSERLWTMPDASALAANDDAPLSSRLDAEVGYGMALFGGGFTGTPNVGFGLSDTARELRMGWRLSPAGAAAGDFSFRIDASRRDSAGETPEHRIGFGIDARW